MVGKTEEFTHPETLPTLVMGYHCAPCNYITQRKDNYIRHLKKCRNNFNEKIELMKSGTGHLYINVTDDKLKTTDPLSHCKRVSFPTGVELTTALENLTDDKKFIPRMLPMFLPVFSSETVSTEEIKKWYLAKCE